MRRNVTPLGFIVSGSLTALILTSACELDEELTYLDGMQQGCLDAGGSWDAESEQCESVAETSWVMAQSAASVSFAFDDAIDETCPEGALWSGTMAMQDVSAATVLFSDMPRHTFSEPTELFHEQWDKAWFTEENGGNPSGIVYWASPPQGEVRAVILKLSSSGPQFEEGSNTWTHQVCGMTPGEAPRDEGNVSTVLEERPVAEPEACAGGFSVAIYQHKAWDNWCSIDLSRCRPPSPPLPHVCGDPSSS